MIARQCKRGDNCKNVQCPLQKHLRERINTKHLIKIPKIVYLSKRKNYKVTTSTTQFTLDAKAMQKVEAFMYTGSVMDKYRESYADVSRRDIFTRSTFFHLKNIWD